MSAALEKWAEVLTEIVESKPAATATQRSNSGKTGDLHRWNKHHHSQR